MSARVLNLRQSVNILTWLIPKFIFSPISGLAIIAACVLIIIVGLLWYCLLDAAAIGAPFQGISMGAQAPTK